MGNVLLFRGGSFYFLFYVMVMYSYNLSGAFKKRVVYLVIVEKGSNLSPQKSTFYKKGILFCEKVRGKGMFDYFRTIICPPFMF